MTASHTAQEAYTRGSPEHDWRATIDRILIAAKEVGCPILLASSCNHLAVYGNEEMLRRLRALLPNSVADLGVASVNEPAIIWTEEAHRAQAR